MTFHQSRLRDGSPSMLALIFWLSVLFVVYTYAGYPILIALLARFRSNPKAFSRAPYSVTLLITAYNEEAVIAKKIENSLSLNYDSDKLQILVAADGSS